MAREPIELSTWECESLLRAHVVGRVALAAPDGPYVFPVNYSVVDSTILLRTAPYGVLGRLGREAPLAFEIDQFDHERQRGWSVLVRGRGEPVTDPAEIAHIDRVWPPQPWATGTRPLHIRLRWNEVSGRKLGSGWEPRDTAETRRVV
ncbi:pyridoxamine 5'-phosphate oxidase family protein [Nocardioides coralli]|uniref:pyridoxamine 5'-phosphate oxidase family protein n=1 Tax=Nocardioides coralli TaxID=2872154 RepID=UPI001CA3A9AD|nr:pyridoxamine 5'-phosphate oxidase family protein [Nocardioides coralli]QZY28693.1 pyridoxamine 5'-phosphate oxidase family protein [Nocardioides coralli]